MLDPILFLSSSNSNSMFPSQSDFCCSCFFGFFFFLVFFFFVLVFFFFPCNILHCVMNGVILHCLSVRQTERCAHTHTRVWFITLYTEMRKELIRSVEVPDQRRLVAGKKQSSEVVFWVKLGIFLDLCDHLNVARFKKANHFTENKIIKEIYFFFTFSKILFFFCSRYCRSSIVCVCSR